MQNLKERIIAIGCWFKADAKNYHDRLIPRYTIKTCNGKGDRNTCNSAKFYILDKSSRNRVAIWKVACMNCKRRWNYQSPSLSANNNIISSTSFHDLQSKGKQSKPV